MATSEVSNVLLCTLTTEAYHLCPTVDSNNSIGDGSDLVFRARSATFCELIRTLDFSLRKLTYIRIRLHDLE